LHSTQARYCMFFEKYSKLFSKVQIDLKREFGSKGGVARHQSVTTEPHNFKCSVGAISAEFPCSAATFVVI
jgi:hypothetical protein